MKEIISLHAIPEFEEIHVRNNVKLRPLHSSHAERLLKILNDDSSIRDRVTVASRFHTPEDVKAEIERYKEDSGLIRYALLKDNNPIGLVSLWRDEGYFGTEPQLDDYGFGFFLDPNERGKGLVGDAVQTLMETVAKNLQVNQFVAFSEDDNAKSIAVLTKLGFKPTDQTLTEPIHGWIERKYVRKVSSS